MAEHGDGRSRWRWLLGDTQKSGTSSKFERAERVDRPAQGKLGVWRRTRPLRKRAKRTFGSGVRQGCEACEPIARSQVGTAVTIGVGRSTRHNRHHRLFAGFSDIPWHMRWPDSANRIPQGVHNGRGALVPPPAWKATTGHSPTTCSRRWSRDQPPAPTASIRKSSGLTGRIRTGRTSTSPGASSANPPTCGQRP